MRTVPINFVETDAGRSNSKRPKQKNDCTVRALAVVTGVSYDQAYDFVKDLGRKSHRGFHIHVFLNRIAALGDLIKSDELIFGYRVVRHSFPAQKGKKRMCVATFCAQYPKGRFILRQAKHVRAVVDGTVHDLFWDDAPCVYTAYEFVRTQ